jgi:hypothetical protein
VWQIRVDLPGREKYMGNLLQALYSDITTKGGEENFKRHVEEEVSLLPKQLQQIPSNSNSNTALTAANRIYGTSSTAAAVASMANKTQQALQTVHIAGGVSTAVGAVATVAGPVGMASSWTVDKLVQLRRWWKTRMHLHALVLIYFMALDEHEDANLLDALVFTIQQKKIKLSKAGLKGLIPGYVALETQYTHLTKLWDGSLKVKEYDAAKTLFEYAYELNNEYAQRAIAELFNGGGSGLEDLITKVNLLDKDDYSTMLRSDDDEPDDDAGSHSSSSSDWGNKTGFGRLEKEVAAPMGKTAKMGLLQKTVANLKGRGDYTPLDQTYESADEPKEECIRKIVSKLDS